MKRLTIILLSLGFIALVAYGVYQWWQPRRHHQLVHKTLRLLHIALEENYLEEYRYPYAMDDEGNDIKGTGVYKLGMAPWRRLKTETTSKDMYRIAKRTHYGSDAEKNLWIMVHPGPDGSLQIDLEDWIMEAKGDLQLYQSLHLEGLLGYDPTNGAISRGDIFRTGP